MERLGFYRVGGGLMLQEAARQPGFRRNKSKTPATRARGLLEINPPSDGGSDRNLRFCHLFITQNGGWLQSRSIPPTCVLTSTFSNVLFDQFIAPRLQSKSIHLSCSNSTSIKFLKVPESPLQFDASNT